MNGKYVLISLVLLAFSVFSQDAEKPDNATGVISAGSEKSATKQETEESASSSQRADIQPLLKTVKSNFKAGNYGAADKAVDMALELQPDDYEAVKYKGMISVKKGDMETAGKFLESALTAGAEDSELDFYYAAYLEKTGKYIKAEEVLSGYEKYGIFDSYRGKMKTYLGYVSDKAAKKRAKEAVSAEKSIAGEIRPNTVSVVSFVNKGGEDDYSVLSKGLAEMIATDLSQVERLTVVERVQMQALVDEMALGQTGLIEEGNAVKVGKILGAEKVVNGAFFVKENNIKMMAGMADVKVGTAKSAGKAEGSLEEIFKLEKDLVFNIIKEMGIVLTDSEREAVEKIPTENVLAFLAYSKGLDAEDRGDYSAAADFYSQAAKEDPEFRKASESAEDASLKSAAQSSKDLTSVKKPAAAVSSQITTPVVTVGSINISAQGSGSLSALNTVNSSFMPEIEIGKTLLTQSVTEIEGQTEGGVSYTDSYNIGFGGGTKDVDVKAPIPEQF